MHRVERLVHLEQTKLVRDGLVHQNLLLHVLVHERGNTGVALESTEVAASPATAGHEQRSSNTDEARLASAHVATLERNTHGLVVVDALDRVVQTAEALLQAHPGADPSAVASGDAAPIKHTLSIVAEGAILVTEITGSIVYSESVCS
ncbi:hypothetical protein PF011_g32343 [Phytophthora fragariae]|uniref:Uncharacterized protein n=1 Tax=Phytophthora fragariae TaxID=53985 RepID=A0A6A3G5F6_9STRA|nr:hypothetical protein PF003_g12772 [Phytophthora fragariae]KAE8903366.1 hypothetical protein PF003_g12755 [Phytophthora fragariae]KAE8953695.1 hypothetical protein PF011_g32343 [Phytophthora fragariae]KAE9277856.1 hypothetical protein PF008_g28759 [Phytophthora fragariae]